MGNMLINVLAQAVMWGLNGALETFVSRSFGEGNKRMCGVYLNRGKFVCTLIMIPIAVVFSQSDKILIAIKQDVAVSTIARQYCCIMIPGVWATGLFDGTRKFLSSQF
jgi:Na+-driven multidrug efflux pump